ncbi:hypothetical protein Bpfe_019506 [Biomphalaria pfeifferi]|uniref:Uncharacterized protein n=1 Tax=Biomphalaria pfeifferi TaxID=112525 RepID=A0AAD8BAQ8_BIOPF|nr:hypothetical protein Bpfe_019506 [Biomphalaria pfeifferi]
MSGTDTENEAREGRGALELNETNLQPRSSLVSEVSSALTDRMPVSHGNCGHETQRALNIYRQCFVFRTKLISSNG